MTIRIAHSDDDGYWVRDDTTLSYYEVCAPAKSDTHSIVVARVGKNYGIARAVAQLHKHRANL